MRQCITALWADESGFIISAELVLIGTLLILGLVVGLTSIRDAISGELTDVAEAFRGLDQSYYYGGMRSLKNGGRGVKAWTAGSFHGHEPVEDVTWIECAPAPAPAPQVIVPPAPVIVPECVPVVPECEPVVSPCPPVLEAPCLPETLGQPETVIPCPEGSVRRYSGSGSFIQNGVIVPRALPVVPGTERTPLTGALVPNHALTRSPNAPIYGKSYYGVYAPYRNWSETPDREPTSQPLVW